MDILDRALNISRKMPKAIDPPTHAALDYLTTSLFFVMAGFFWGRHKRASGAALVNAGMVLGLSILTDYPGGLGKVSFRTHGKGDILQMLTAAGLPGMLGFGNEAAALPFRLRR
jgi:hypothetical protein